MSTRSKKFWKQLLNSPERFFLITASIFGIAFILLTPPLQTPDETQHFLRAYQVSQLGVFSSWQNGTLGAELPISLSKTIDLVNNPRIEFHPEYKYDIHKTAAALHVPLNKSDSKFLGVANTSGYSAIGYLPQSILVGTGALFNAPPVLLMYMAKVGSLLAWVGLIFLSIRIIPYRKWTLAGLALLPMLIAQAGSPGIDSVSIGLSVFFISCVLYLRIQKAISMKWWILLVAIGCFIALTKQTAILAVAFALLLPQEKFDRDIWKARAKKWVLIGLPLMFIVGWSLIVSYQHLSVGSGVPGQDGSAQLANVIQHPLRLPKVIFNTFFFTWGDGVITSFIGSFGWLDAPLAGGWVVFGYVLLAFLLFVSYEKTKQAFSRIERWIVIAIVGLYVLGTIAALYLTYSPVDFGVIYGLQGRYFLLVPFMLIPLILTSSLKLPEEKYAKVVKVGMPILLIGSAVTIYMRFYFTGLL